MTQFRLHFIASSPRATELFQAVEQTFEEDGFPVAKFEVDEARELHEISVYTSDPKSADARIRALFVPGESLEIQIETLPDIDWVAKSLEGLKPVRSGRFLLHGSHDRGARRSGDLAIEIEAGQAFGTGHHGTTEGCLQMIQQVVRRERPANALDLGTGSAVLAIAMAKLSPIAVLASDIDPVAAHVAAANTKLNGVSNWVSVVTATGFRDRAITNSRPFDLIVANVLAGPLMRLAPSMAQHLAPGGSAILSGILDRQRRAVIAAYVNHRFRHVHTMSRGEWVTIQLKR